MRCPACNKFVPFDDSNEPEVNGVDVEPNGEVTADVRVVLTCAECGEELKESSLNPSETVDLSGHVVPEGEEDDHQLEVADEGAELETRTEGSGRGLRTYYGARVTAKVTCTGCDFEADVELFGEVRASEMEELV